MNLNEIEGSRRLLNRAFDTCQAHGFGDAILHPELASRFVLDCHRFMRATTATQALAAASDRLRFQHRQLVSELDRHEKELLAEVRNFVKKLTPNPTSQGRDGYLPLMLSSDEVDDLSELLRWGRTAVSTISEKLLEDVNNLYHLTPDQSKVLRQLNERVAIQSRKLSLFARQSPGFAYGWLSTMCQAMNPEPRTTLAMLEPNQSGDFGMVARALFVRDRLVDDERSRFVVMWMRARHAIESVHYEIAFLLGQRDNLNWVLARYATRSRWYHLKRLQHLAKSASRAAELNLTRDVCSYIFDLGFDAVYPEVASGSSRYDLVGHVGAERVLVEAKITREGSTKKLIINAANQIRNFASQKLAEGEMLQSVLLIFRLGGPTVILPAFVPHPRLPIFLSCVDLGKSTDSGSKVRGGIDVKEQDLEFRPQ